MIKILVVDDDDIFRGLLKDSLTQSGNKIVTAQDGLRALRELEKQRFDMVITDIVMPEKEGIEVIREIKAKYPDVKIIAMSGGSPFLHAELNLKLAKKVGADLALQKPFMQNELIASINQLFPNNSNNN
ncbi:MAG: response regulator [Calditrichaeota bacterium]|nr:MAG: response regulator [Calditrichota bacterium]MBL1205649.1 response regulator [Calditrichota bacterium]NOG45477.1 response regulator [Calditrichota bacterium]